MVVSKDCGVGGNGEILVKGCKLLVIRWTTSEDWMYNMVIRVNDNVLYTWNLLRGRSEVFSPKKSNYVRLQMH